MINHKCSCCYPVFDGPTSSLKTCHGCGNQFFSYQAGGYVRQQPYYCVDCVEKNSVAEVIGHADGLIKYNKPTGDKMNYDDTNYKQAVEVAKTFSSHTELKDEDAYATPQEVNLSKALLAAQEHIAFLETKIEELENYKCDGCEHLRLDQEKQITALEACIVEKDKTLNKFAEADKCITGASGPSTGTISYWVKGPNAVMAEKALSLTPESVKRVAEAKDKVIEECKKADRCGFEKTGEIVIALAELEALQRGEK